MMPPTPAPTQTALLFILPLYYNRKRLRHQATKITLMRRRNPARQTGLREAGGSIEIATHQHAGNVGNGRADNPLVIGSEPSIGRGDRLEAGS